MIFAIIPWNKDYDNDRIFNSELYTDGIELPLVAMRDEFVNLGHEIHTIDLCDIDKVDYFLFFVMNWEWLKKLIRLGREDSFVYCNAEPPSVEIMNTLNGYEVLKLFFPYILTWNDDWIDNVTIFKRNIPYHFEDKRCGMLDFNQKKLVTFISANNVSNFEGELYSERRKAIDYFEQKHPEDFEFYGFGWDADEHICYNGAADNKSIIYHKFRFAICYENIKGYRGYITEKILDCLVSGIVPVYCGAPDVTKYIPQNAFINLEDYEDYDSLYEYLISIDENIYKEYLQAAGRFINSKKSEEFKGERYTEYIIDAIENRKRFKVSVKGHLYLIRRDFYQLRLNMRRAIIGWL